LSPYVAAPFGDAEAIKAEFSGGTKDTLVILRRAWEVRNKVKIPMAITNLLDSPRGDDRELAIVLWLVWATKSGGEVWEAYATWLPQPGSMATLLLADDRELRQLQDEDLAVEARELQATIAAAYARLPAINAAAMEMAGAPVPVGVDAGPDAAFPSLTLVLTYVPLTSTSTSRHLCAHSKRCTEC
jgi:tryptophan synthase beta chain